MRKQHVAAQPEATRALLFRRLPAPLLERIPADAIVGLYRATPYEAPARHYATFLLEEGHTVALPRFADRSAPMEFAIHTDPLGESDLEAGPLGLMQPKPDAETVVPDVLFVPLVGFTAAGERLGQGGGHYDRWLAKRPDTLTIGMAWDCQLVDELPLEPHDQPLDAVVTPTRLYGPF